MSRMEWYLVQNISVYDIITEIWKQFDNDTIHIYNKIAEENKLFEIIETQEDIKNYILTNNPFDSIKPIYIDLQQPSCIISSLNKGLIFEPIKNEIHPTYPIFVLFTDVKTYYFDCILVADAFISKTR